MNTHRVHQSVLFARLCCFGVDDNILFTRLGASHHEDNVLFARLGEPHVAQVPCLPRKKKREKQKKSPNNKPPGSVHHRFAWAWDTFDVKMCLTPTRFAPYAGEVAQQ